MDSPDDFQRNDAKEERRQLRNERFDPTSFPHPPLHGSTHVALTIENLQHLMSEAGIAARFNVIKKRLEIRKANGSVTSLNEVVSLAHHNRMATGWIPSFLDEIGVRNPYNPVEEWIRSKPWDGTDRVSAICETVVTREDYPESLKDRLLYRWLLSVTAAAVTDKRFRARGVLTFQGEQGIGKTSWIATLLPAGELRNNCIKLDHHLDASNKDSIINAVGHLVTEIGELDSSFKKDVARLKGFLTNDCDKLRRPYAREESEYPRRTVFAATVNEEQFLIDHTGNSRWWTIAVERLDFHHSVDMQQLYAQLATHLDRGEQWWLTKDEEEDLALYNCRHRSVSAIGERLREYLDLASPSGPGCIAKTAIELLREIGIGNPTNTQCRECGAALRELFGPPKRINGRDKWRVRARDSYQAAVSGPRVAPGAVF